MSQAVRFQVARLNIFIYNDHSFETLTMIAIPHTMIYGRPLSQESTTKNPEMTSTFYSAPFKNLYTFFLYTPIQ